jgi:erythromycin esterase-like protein
VIGKAGENFESVINEFETDRWKGRRNKVKALREILRRDNEATKEFLTAYQLKELPKLAATGFDVDTLAKQGWLNDVCGYFDAIEAIDFYLSLRGDV